MFLSLLSLGDFLPHPPPLSEKPLGGGGEVGSWMVSPEGRGERKERGVDCWESLWEYLGSRKLLSTIWSQHKQQISITIHKLKIHWIYWD